MSKLLQRKRQQEHKNEEVRLASCEAFTKEMKKRVDDQEEWNGINEHERFYVHCDAFNQFVKHVNATTNQSRIKIGVFSNSDRYYGIRDTVRDVYTVVDTDKNLVTYNIIKHV